MNIQKTIAVLIVLAFCAYLAAWISPVYLNPLLKKVHNKEVVIVAHRGGAGYGKENNIATMRETLSKRAYPVEADVQMTKDGVLVLFHDKTLRRLFNVDKVVQELQWNELNSIANNSVTRFDSAMMLLKGRSEFLIEIKRYQHYDAVIEKKVCHYIDSLDGYSWCVVQSFDENVLKRIHIMNPRVRLAKLIVGKVPLTDYYFDYENRPKSLSDIDFCESIHVNRIFTTQALVDWVHARNKKVKVWTVNDCGDMRKFAGMGVDGIITDYPGLYEYH